MLMRVTGIDIPVRIVNGEIAESTGRFYLLADPSFLVREAAGRLWLYHAADSNRQAVGRGHTDFEAQVAALDFVGYNGPVIVECTAPGPDPFTAIKNDQSLTWLERYLAESRAWFQEKLTE